MDPQGIYGRHSMGSNDFSDLAVEHLGADHGRHWYQWACVVA